MTPSAVAQVAEELSLPLIKSNQIDDQTLEQIGVWNPDLGLVVAYGAFLGQRALNAISKGWINLHYSLLPKYRGAAPVQHALLSGETLTGVSVFQLDPGMDTGAIFLQVPTQIETGESAGRLLDRLTEIGITALKEVLPAIASGVAIATVQDDVVASFAPKITREQAKINWSISSRQIENLIRAMNPEPIAWTEYNGDSIKIIEARAVSDEIRPTTSMSPGTVFQHNDEIFVLCADSALSLSFVQPAGKPQMSASDWFRGQQKKDSIAFDS